MLTDDICERYAARMGDLSLKLLPDDADGEDTILIQGSGRSLRFLAELLMAVADEEPNDGCQLGPRDAGSRHFAAESEFGIYIHRLDNTLQPIDAMPPKLG